MTRELGPRTLKVRPDVFFVRSDDGVWLRNNVGSLFVKGRRSYGIVRSLLEELDGTRTVDEVFDGLGAEQRDALVQRVLAPLVVGGFVFEIRGPAEALPAWMDERLREHLAFLEQYVDRPLERLMRVRTRTVACVGGGLPLRAAAVALADLGFARVRLAGAGDPAEADELRAVAAAAGELDPHAEWSLAWHPGEAQVSALLRAALQGAADGDGEPAGVLVAGAPGGAAELADAVDALRRRGHPVVVVAPVGESILASPVVDGDAWCWACLRHAVPSAAAVDPAPPSASLAAFQAAQRLFCRFAGAPVPEDRQLSVVDVRTLAVQALAPRRHPGCTRHGPALPFPALSPADAGEPAPARPDVASSHDAPDSVAAQDRIVDTVGGWVNRVAGPLLTVGEEELRQLPLAGSRCRVRDPRLSSTESSNSRRWIDPTDPAESGESVEAGRSADSSSIPEPTESDVSSKSAGLVDSVDSVNSVDSVDSVDSVESVESVDSIDSTEPVDSVESIAPTWSAVDGVQTLECRAVAPREARNQAVLLALEWLAGAAAEARGVPAGSYVFGAGWSAAEAAYRARAAAALDALPAHPLADARTESFDADAASPVRAFLLGTLADLGVDDPRVCLAPAREGLTSAWIVNGAGGTLGRGAGLDDAHAADHALADAVARFEASPASAATRVATAHPAPSEGRWPAPDAAPGGPLLDARALLPFAADRAWIVALPSADAADGGGAG